MDAWPARTSPSSGCWISARISGTTGKVGVGSGAGVSVAVGLGDGKTTGVSVGVAVGLGDGSSVGVSVGVGASGSVSRAVGVGVAFWQRTTTRTGAELEARALAVHGHHPQHVGAILG